MCCARVGMRYRRCPRTAGTSTNSSIRSPVRPGKVVTRRAGFVDHVTGFDAPFFGMSTREVRMMDPQHRLLLETAWRAVEHSGTAPTALANTNTGVFVGLATHDYLGMASDELTYPEIEAYMAIGTSNAAAAGRISYRLGLQGPAVAVDTACSSSLVAIHQACQALRLGECDLALAGGANVLLTPATMITFSSAHMLAPDGRCKTFDAAADGYVRGEGCGVIVIKRLEDARSRRRPDSRRDPWQRDQPGRRVRRVDGAEWRCSATGHRRRAEARRPRAQRSRIPGGARHGDVVGRPDRSSGRRCGIRRRTRSRAGRC